MQVTIDISDKFAAVISGLSDAIRNISGSAAVGQAVETKAAAVDKPAAVDKAARTTKTTQSKSEGPIYWADNTTGFFGKVDSEAEYEAKKADADGVYKTTESIYNEKLVELKAKKDASAAKKEAATAKSDAEPAKHPTVEELVAVFAKYLPKSLSKEERAERAKFVKPMLERFGASKASELLPEHRALAMNLVERKLAGEDIDPTSSDFAELCAEVEEDMI